MVVNRYFGDSQPGVGGKLIRIASGSELPVFIALLRETRFQHLTVTILTSQVSQIVSPALGWEKTGTTM